MAKRLGFGKYQYELVEGWPKVPIQGAAADVAVDDEGRVYVGVRNPKPDGSVGTSRGGVGHVVVLDRDGREIVNWGDFASAPHGLWANQDDEGRELCKMAIILDPEGNVIMLHQMADWRRGDRTG